MSQQSGAATCVIIGDPVDQSLSPQMHTAAYKELGIEKEFAFTTRQIIPAELAGFMQEVRSTGIRGVSCTAPHKVAIMDYLDEVESEAAKIGAVNSVVNDNGTLRGYNTDWMGVVTPLNNLGALRGKRVALLGAGGAARAIAYGMVSEGAELTIYNRTLERAQELAQAFGAEAGSLEDLASLDTIKSADIIINATSVGMSPQDDETPLPQTYIAGWQTVFDIVYSPYETRLLREARQQGAHVIHGTEMLLYQGTAQFKLYTGYDAPEEAMRTALQDALGIKEEDR